VKKLLAILAVGAVAAGCAAVKPPAPAPSPDWYYTSVQLDANLPAGTYTVDTTCTEEDGTSATWTDLLEPGELQFYAWNVGIAGDNDANGPVLADPETCTVSTSLPLTWTHAQEDGVVMPGDSCTFTIQVFDDPAYSPRESCDFVGSV
jgi:hypothetical protein